MFYFPAENKKIIASKKPVSLLGYVLLFLVIFSILGMAVYGVLTIFMGYEIVFTNKSTVPQKPVTSAVTVTPTMTPTKVVQPTPTIEAVKISSIDQIWNLYTNSTLGYSIKIPKTSMAYAGKCAYIEKNDHSFRVFDDLVPVVVLEASNGVYISNEYFFEPSGVTKENGTSYFSACDKTLISSTLLDERRIQVGSIRKPTPSNWLIQTKTVNNEDELLSFVKEKYGQGCKLGPQKLNENGVIDVEIATDLKLKTLENSTCPINYKYALKYSSEKKLAATWGIGQEIIFSGPNHKPAYDQIMIDSFKFL